MRASFWVFFGLHCCHCCCFISALYLAELIIILYPKKSFRLKRHPKNIALDVLPHSASSFLLASLLSVLRGKELAKFDRPLRFGTWKSKIMRFKLGSSCMRRRRTLLSFYLFASLLSRVRLRGNPPWSWSCPAGPQSSGHS